MVSDNPIDIMIRHIGKSHIVALQKGKPGVIILEIQSLPHPFGHLVNKAEDAFVMAAPIFVHQPVLKRNSQILVVLLIHLQQPLLPVRFLHQHLDIIVLYQELVVKDILDLRIVYGQQPVPWRNLQFLRNTARQYAADHMPFFLIHISVYSCLHKCELSRNFIFSLLENS